MQSLMSTTEERLDRVVEALSQVAVNLESLRLTLAAVGEASDDHEARIRSVERRHHQLTPVLAAMTFTLGALFSAALGRLF